jgi:hypothetical protein
MEHNRRLKQEYRHLHDSLTELLYRYDPIGLAVLGAPTDEYVAEAGSIIPRLREAKSKNDVRRIVHQEFVRWFDGSEEAGSESAYDGIAQEIWDKLLR